MEVSRRDNDGGQEATGEDRLEIEVWTRNRRLADIRGLDEMTK